MIDEIGHFALVLALCIAAVQIVVPLYGASRLQQTGLPTRPGASCAKCNFVSQNPISLRLIRALIYRPKKSARVSGNRVKFSGVLFDDVSALLRKKTNEFLRRVVPNEPVVTAEQRRQL